MLLNLKLNSQKILKKEIRLKFLNWILIKELLTISKKFLDGKIKEFVCLTSFIYFYLLAYQRI